MDKYYNNLCETTDIMGYISRIDNYDMLDVSDYLLQCLGLKKDEYVGRKCHDVIHGKHTPCQFCNNSRLKVGEYDKWYAYNPLLDAHLAVRDTLVPHEEFGEVRMEICYEITKEVKSIENLQASESFDKAVGACAKTLLDDNDDAAKSIGALLKTLCNYFGGVYSTIIEYNKQLNTAGVTYEYTLDPQLTLKDKFKNMPLNLIEDWYEFSDNDDKVFVDMHAQNLHKDSQQYLRLQTSKLTGTIIAPLRKNGVKFGSITVANPTKNTDDVRLLKTVSAFIVNFIERQKLIKDLEVSSFVDLLTGLKNRNSFEGEIENLKVSSPESLGIIFCDVNGLKEANDNLGHEYGDVLIKWAARFLGDCIDAPLFRIGGDEFVSFVTGVSKQDMESILEKIKRGLDELRHVNISVGYDYSDKIIDVDAQLKRADKNMYQVKQDYYAEKKYNHMNLKTQYHLMQRELERLKMTL